MADGFFDTTYSTTIVAKLLGLTTRRIQQLTSDGVLEKALDVDGKGMKGKYNLADTVQGYIKYLQRYHIEGGGVDGEIQNEKLLRLKSAREADEMKLAQLKGEMHYGSDVEQVMTDMLTSVRARLLSIPNRLAPRLLNKTNTALVQSILKESINEALVELSDYSPDMFDADEANGGGDDSDAA